MKEHFIPTAKKILGVIILVFIFSLFGLLPFISNPTAFITGQGRMAFGLPLYYVSLQGGSLSEIRYINLLIDIVFFYFIVCVLSLAFGGKKDEDKVKQEEGRKDYVSNSDSAGGNSSSANQTQS
ncbi:MAG: hypothetical protein V1678_01830 [Candidatus Aenigmatarchaeota archaeon]